jgi:ABC-type glycerol-3-phosphate transport system substrate-binding protein
MRLVHSLLIPLVLALGLAACGGRSHQGATSPDAEYSDEEEWAQTPSQGPGSQTSSGFYGSGSSGPPERTPAEPSARP